MPLVNINCEYLEMKQQYFELQMMKFKLVPCLAKLKKFTYEKINKF